MGVTGKTNKPSMELICEWIIQGWGPISKETVVKNLKKKRNF
jgi:hypothetical protein